MQQAQQAATRMPSSKAAEDLITKFADTEFKAYALGAEADATSQGRSHQSDRLWRAGAGGGSRHFTTDTLLANIYANTTRDTDLDKEEKLKKAEKYAHDAIAAVQAAAKPNAAGQRCRVGRREEERAGAGLSGARHVALVRKKYDEAMADFPERHRPQSRPGHHDSRRPRPARREEAR